MKPSDLSRDFEDDDLVVIVTEGGKPDCFYTEDYDEVLRNADAIQGFMVDAVKDPLTRRGKWSWRIKVGCDEMWGEYIGG